MRRMVGAPWLVAMAVAVFLLAFFSYERDASAVPSFARKYKTSCTTCHTVYPMLNPFGEAFRRNGYRFPSHEGSVDSDSIKAETLPLGQEEYKRTFPDSVWPDQIMQDVPLSVMANGQTSASFNDAKEATGNTYTHDGIVAELHLFAAGAFNDTLTYFSQLTFASDGTDIETAYLLWNDVVGPAHAVNVWVGRLMSPSLTSFGMHSSYLSDTYMPATSIAGLYNPSGSFSLGMGHADGIEVNGVVGHRLGYSLGWLTSGTAAGLKTPNAEDAYAHLGAKIGGMSLDGEGASGMFTADSKRPWEERSLTIDVFGYHGLTRMDNGTGVPPGAVPQNDAIAAVGGSLRGLFDSLIVTAGAQVERHSRPYQGTPATAATATQPAFPGVPDFTAATALSQYDEIDYVVFPWLVPGVRAEYTRLGLEDGTKASVLRLIPGVAALVRQNIKVVVTGVFETAHGVPPVASWGPAGAFVTPDPGATVSMRAEQVNAAFAVAF